MTRLCGKHGLFYEPPNTCWKCYQDQQRQLKQILGEQYEEEVEHERPR